MKRLSGWAVCARRWRGCVANRCGDVKRRWKKHWRNGVSETARFVWEALRTDDAETRGLEAASVGETAALASKSWIFSPFPLGAPIDETKSPTSGKRPERTLAVAKAPSVVLTFDDVWTLRSPRFVVFDGFCEPVRHWLDVYELTLNRLLEARGTENFWRDVAKAGLSAYFAPEPRDDWRIATKLADGVYFDRRRAPEFLRANLNRLTKVAGFLTNAWRFECVEVKPPRSRA
ncbi:MAG: hypothetical protein IKW13_06860 [Thermoguttaceae bacterium]|nr:hypothetical protein [Thermoguttaceae bacterium]